VAAETPQLKNPNKLLRPCSLNYPQPKHNHSYPHQFSHSYFFNMADQIQRLLEDQIPELEEYQAHSLFSSPEIHSIVKQRTNFEYKIKRKDPMREDFLRYIEYELSLDKLRKMRKQRSGQHKPVNSDFAIQRRINFIYERLLRKFTADSDLWLQYINFAVHCKSSHIVAKLFPRAIINNIHNADLWLKAIEYEIQTNNNQDAARIYAQRALRFNPDSTKIWLYFFYIEILYIAKCFERKKILGINVAEAKTGEIDLRFVQKVDKQLQQDENNGQEQENQNINSAITNIENKITDKSDLALIHAILPRTIYKNAIKQPGLLENLDFRLDFLKFIPLQGNFYFNHGQIDNKTLELFYKHNEKGSKSGYLQRVELEEIVEDIYESIEQDFAEKNEQAWLIKAEKIINFPNLNSESVENDKSPIELAVETLESGLSQLSTARMHEIYVTFLLEQLKLAPSGEIALFLTQKLTFLLKKLGKTGQNITEKIYLDWIELLESVKQHETAQIVAKQAISRFPNSFSLHKLHLNTIIHVQNNANNSDLAPKRTTKRSKQANSAPIPQNSAVDLDFLHKTLQNSIEKLNSPSEKCELCGILLNFLRTLPQSEENRTKIREIYIFALQTSGNYSPGKAEIARNYLNWLEKQGNGDNSVDSQDSAVSKGINDVLQCSPVPLSVFLEVLVISERSSSPQHGPSVARLRRLFEECTNLHGERAVEPWLQWIEWETGRKEWKKAAGIYTRAIRVIGPELRAEFEQRHAQLQ
jgi:hypothetical protein